jgi:hypothetical protein
MTAEGAFLRHSTAPGVERDQYKRPMILPPGMTDRRLAIPYTRASTLAKYLDDSFAIQRWETRHAVRGMGEREDLAAMAAGLPWGPTYDETPRSTMAELDRIAEEAKRYAGRDLKANYGTAMHSFTDPVEGKGDVPARMVSDVAAYDAKMKETGLKIVQLERFVVCDQLRAAGSFDYVVYSPELDCYVIVDKKTGKIGEHSFAIQTAVYANGVPYENGQRRPWDKDISKDWGLIIWIPAHQGRCEIIWVDIKAGYLAARHAAWNRDWLKKQNLMQPYVPGTIPERSE